ncbi:MAG: hypothetical protein SPF15_00375 [Candidatus Cryptobacteroides sp.]|nr:hypothetical protein [Candidatus Cryptobacteroides sp.]MDY5042449.1 hypothetical protein [Candidatus Cryptobacteroides sp.]
MFQLAGMGINEYAAAICQFVSARQAWESHEYATGICQWEQACRIRR